MELVFFLKLIHLCVILWLYKNLWLEPLEMKAIYSKPMFLMYVYTHLHLLIIK